MFATYASLVFGVLAFGLTEATLTSDDIQLCLCSRESLTVCENLTNAERFCDKLNATKPTMLFLPGFTENANSSDSLTICDAYLKLGTYNALVLNYGQNAGVDYLKAVAISSTIGRLTASALNGLFKKCLDRDTLHIVGHSWGGQVAGYIADETQIVRIIALDPAGPLFYVVAPHLKPGLANFTVVIHTNGGGFGYAFPEGDVDFFVNPTDPVEPSCPIFPDISKPILSQVFCSHQMSWKYYTEAILNQSLFLGRKCDNALNFVSGKCDKNEVIPMGLATPTNAKGLYFLWTNKEKPYGAGVKGAEGSESWIYKHLFKPLQS